MQLLQVVEYILTSWLCKDDSSSSPNFENASEDNGNLYLRESELGVIM